MKKIVFIISFLLIICFSSKAEDIYVSQNAAGSDDGTSCINAKSLSWATNASNYGSGANKISAGDTVHLCGIFTQTLDIRGSGSAGNLTTWLFEPGAAFVLSAGAYTTGINAENNNYFIIDGGGTGRIEWTNNGTAGPYSNATSGIIINGATIGNIEIKNLIITNGFLHLTSDTRTSDVGVGVQLNSQGATNISIHNCYFDMIQRAIYLVANSGSGRTAHLYFYSNVIDHAAHGMGGGNGGNGAFIEHLCVYGNRIDGNEAWMQLNNHFHLNAIYFFIGSQVGAYMSNIFIFNNEMGPMTGVNNNTTSYIFLSADVQGDARIVNTYIFNNILHGADYSNGKIMLWIAYDSYVFNNTLNDDSTLLYRTGGGSLSIVNNIFSRSANVLYFPDPLGTASLECNKNNYSEFGYLASFYGEINFQPWNTWTNSYGFDRQSNTNLANFTSIGTYNFHIPAGTNTAASGTGTNLTSWINSLTGTYPLLTNALKDFDGNRRSDTAPWSMGAYESNYVSESSSVSLPAVIFRNGKVSGKAKIQ